MFAVTRISSLATNRVLAYIRIDDEQLWQQELKRELLAAKIPVAEAE
jgi:hypothetical protein